jgi:hypothetical protein
MVDSNSLQPELLSSNTHSHNALTGVDVLSLASARRVIIYIIFSVVGAPRWTADTRDSSLLRQFHTAHLLRSSNHGTQQVRIWQLSPVRHTFEEAPAPVFPSCR